MQGYVLQPAPPCNPGPWLQPGSAINSPPAAVPQDVRTLSSRARQWLIRHAALVGNQTARPRFPKSRSAEETALDVPGRECARALAAADADQGDLRGPELGDRVSSVRTGWDPSAALPSPFHQETTGPVPPQWSSLQLFANSTAGREVHTLSGALHFQCSGTGWGQM